ncbi:kinase-like domain-containing protein [Phlebopus sp. FC_14]|nr:kinase-like domain-containing protein [Phlebopus sp. FC_14]
MEHSVAGLGISEQEWSGQYDDLKEHGYTLRPRYRPGWQPFKSLDISEVIRREDGIFQTNPYCLDATRADGTPVFIKQVDRRKHPTEAEIAQFLSSPSLLSDSHNHTIPVLDSFPHKKNPEIQYLVMPLLRPVFPIDEPPFTTIKETIDFVDQTLEGLAFMHEHNVAHRDCSAQNIMMDASDLYPNGWHPMAPWLTRDGKYWSTPHKNRCDLNIRYFFIDFGLSTRFAPGEDHLVVGAKGAAPAPELSLEIPYNPFKLDVYLLGKVFQEHICEAYVDLPFLEPLVKAMTAFNPSDRPTAKEALKRWQDICESTQASSMGGWLHKRNESVSKRIAHDILSLAIYTYFRLTTISDTMGTWSS